MTAAAVNAAQLASQLSTLNSDTLAGNDDARARLLLEAQNLVRRLEDPFDAIRRMTFSEPTLICALLIADRMRLFTALGSPSSAPQDASTLAKSLNASPDLIQRLLRHLSAHQILTPLPSGLYAPTPLSTILSDPDNCVGFREVASRYMPIFAAAPSWLEERGFTCPTDARDTVFQRALGQRGESFFDWLQRPEHKHASDEFGRLMRLGVMGARSWLDVRDVGDLLKGWDGRSAVLVDVGGSLGGDVREFRRRYPGLKGRCVVEDLPATIELAREQEREREEQAKPPSSFSSDSSSHSDSDSDTTPSSSTSTNTAATAASSTGPIEFQPHDFFADPQPERGALMYFMGSILHDWPDADARRILRGVADAMVRGYSTLFLSELVLTDAGAGGGVTQQRQGPQVSAIDVCMLAELGARERTEEDWRALLAQEGLEVVGVWVSRVTARSVIEARLV